VKHGEWMQTMNQAQSHIPEQVYLDFLGRTIDIRWDYHAVVMVFIWFVAVPLCILVIRFGKPRPTLTGLHRKVAFYHVEWWWFTVHKFGLYAAMTLALAAGLVALAVSGGFSGTVHAVFGILAIVLGVLQVITSLLRGKHGGRYYYTADPADPKTWWGDHYNMTPRRRIFEAYHKNMGYIAGFCAAGAVASGLMQYPMPWLLGLVVASVLLVAGAAIVLDYKGFKYDGYRAAHGYDPEHPYNIARKDL
jgi:hypothetical protein